MELNSTQRSVPRTLTNSELISHVETYYEPKGALFLVFERFKEMADLPAPTEPESVQETGKAKCPDCGSELNYKIEIELGE